MGISGLLPLLKSISTHVHVSSYRGKKVAVDAYSWLHKAAYCCSQDLYEGVYTEKFVWYCINKIEMLRSHGVEPVIVFDGGPLPMKAEEEVDRRRNREDARDKVEAYILAGNHKAAEECYQRAVGVTPCMAKQLIEALKAVGVSYVVAPYEADAQLAYLAINGHVWAILTEDSDLLTYGCPRVLFKLDRHGMGEEVVLADLALCKCASLEGFSHDMFVAMCVMAGCDFVKSIPGIGIKKAHAHIKKYKSWMKSWKGIRYVGTLVPPTTSSAVNKSYGFSATSACQSIRYAAAATSKPKGKGDADTSTTKPKSMGEVPPDYELRFQQAMWVFRHQRVFCPVRQRIVHLQPLPPGGIGAADVEYPAAVPEGDESEALSFLGPMLDNELAASIAKGIAPNQKRAATDSLEIAKQSNSIFQFLVPKDSLASPFVSPLPGGSTLLAALGRVAFLSPKPTSEQPEPWKPSQSNPFLKKAPHGTVSDAYTPELAGSQNPSKSNLFVKKDPHVIVSCVYTPQQASQAKPASGQANPAKPIPQQPSQARSRPIQNNPFAIHSAHPSRVLTPQNGSRGAGSTWRTHRATEAHAQLYTGDAHKGNRGASSSAQIDFLTQQQQYQQRQRQQDQQHEATMSINLVQDHSSKLVKGHSSKSVGGRTAKQSHEHTTGSHKIAHRQGFHLVFSLKSTQTSETNLTASVPEVEVNERIAARADFEKGRAWEEQEDEARRRGPEKGVTGEEEEVVRCRFEKGVSWQGEVQGQGDLRNKERMQQVDRRSRLVALLGDDEAEEEGVRRRCFQEGVACHDEAQEEGHLGSEGRKKQQVDRRSRLVALLGDEEAGARHGAVLSPPRCSEVYDEGDVDLAYDGPSQESLTQGLEELAGIGTGSDTRKMGVSIAERPSDTDPGKGWWAVNKGEIEVTTDPLDHSYLAQRQEIGLEELVKAGDRELPLGRAGVRSYLEELVGVTDQDPSAGLDSLHSRSSRHKGSLEAMVGVEDQDPSSGLDFLHSRSNRLKSSLGLDSAEPPKRLDHHHRQASLLGPGLGSEAKIQGDTRHHRQASLLDLGLESEAGSREGEQPDGHGNPLGQLTDKIELISQDAPLQWRKIGRRGPAAQDRVLVLSQAPCFVAITVPDEPDFPTPGQPPHAQAAPLLGVGSAGCSKAHDYVQMAKDAFTHVEIPQGRNAARRIPTIGKGSPDKPRRNPQMGKNNSDNPRETPADGHCAVTLGGRGDQQADKRKTLAKVQGGAPEGLAKVQGPPEVGDFASSTRRSCPRPDALYLMPDAQLEHTRVGQD
eukprot:gene4961-34741_t